jgi:Leucine-rich repeat (LRR) protein
VELPWWTFEHIQELKRLRLSNNERLQIVSGALNKLARIDFIELDLSHCPLLAATPRSWLSLERLLISKTRWSGISMSGCGLKDLSPLSFRLMNNLVQIDLSDNKLKEFRVSRNGTVSYLIKVNLSGNPIRYVDCVTKTLVLEECGLNSIRALLSRETKTYLEALRIENNHLTSINADDFPAMDFPELSTLGLSNNKIRHIGENVLSVFPCLRHLYLNNNQISYIPKGFFTITTRWHWISLINNKISYIHPNAFQTSCDPHNITEILLEIDMNPNLAFQSTECEFSTFAKFQTQFLEPLFVAQDMLEMSQKQSKFTAFHEEFMMKLMAPARLERLFATYGMETVLDGFD